MPNPLNNPLAIIDTRSSSFDATQQEVIARLFAAHARLQRHWHSWGNLLLVTSFYVLLNAVALRKLYFMHFMFFYFPNVMRLVQRIVRFVIRIETKAS